MAHAEDRLRSLSPATLNRLVRGIEKESLRVSSDGYLALTPHPAVLGSALTHPHITTDFSESQLELITGVHPDVVECVGELTAIHQFVHRSIGSDMLWSCSMPCRLPPDDDIPLGQYGTSNLGRLKTVYRAGLARRYGRRMQTISGVHYNFSVPESGMDELQDAHADRRAPEAFRTDQYFALIRNFRRHSWLPLYLFGASPAVCRTFVSGREHRLQPLSDVSLYLPHATSLRMGPLGYQSDAQATLEVSYNSLASYAGSLHQALTVPYPRYEAIGIEDRSGGYRQLATTLLQIENEFYGTIRPKRRIRRGERPLHALTSRGVEYVEVRSLDVDPFSPIGIDAVTMRFLDVFLIHCLLAESVPDSPDAIRMNAENQFRVAERGRESQLRLCRTRGEVGLAQWGGELLEECAPIAVALDAAGGRSGYGAALRIASDRLRDPEQTPSARVLREMNRDFDNSYVDFAIAYSRRHRDAILALPWPEDASLRMQSMAAESLVAQRKIEEADSVPFETYRLQYLAQDLMSGMET